MSESKHTPGPWSRRDTPDYAEIVDRDGRNIAMVAREDDARLIAAAPDLRASCVELLAMCRRQRDFNDDGDGMAFDRADAAIAKAGGE